MDNKTYRIVRELKQKISAKYTPREVRVFGSTARGDRKAESDIDVFVHLPQVNRVIEEDLFDMAYEIELKYDCLIDLIVLSDAGLKGQYLGTPIYQKVLSEGLVV